MILLSIFLLLVQSSSYFLPPAGAPFAPRLSRIMAESTPDLCADPTPDLCADPTPDLCADPRSLPGDPSLILSTNVSLGAEEKVAVMKAISAVISRELGKPESYVAVQINDAQSMIFGGSDAPTALGCLYSLGGIGIEPNSKITKFVGDQLAGFGVAPDRMYINFFDVPRENCGWNGKTFAG